MTLNLLTAFEFVPYCWITSASESLRPAGSHTIVYSGNTVYQLIPKYTLLISSSCFVQSHTSNYSTAVCPHVSKSSCSVVAVWMWNRTKRVGVYLLTAGSASMSQPKIQPKTPVNFTFPSDLKQLSTLEIADHYQICWEHMWFCELHTEALSCKNT